MPSITIGGRTHEILPPRRRLYVSEIGAHLQDHLWLRAAACLVSLGCPSIWPGRQPVYAGDVGRYGEDAHEHLAELGMASDAIIAAAALVWGVWVLSAKGPTTEEVKAEADFIAAGGAPATGSTAGSS